MNDLPMGWEWSSLGEIGKYINGRGFKKTEWRESGRPIIRIQNLTGTSDAFNYFQGEADERHIVRDGDLLVSWAATLGVFVWRGPEAVLNQHIFKVVSYVDPRFHRHLLEHVLGDLQRQTHGSGMVHITKKRFDATPIPVPPLNEQERIVAAIEEHLSVLDRASLTTSAVAARLPRLLDATTRRLIHGHGPSGEAEFSQDPGHPLPEGWSWKRLSDLGEMGRGKSKHRPRNDPILYGGPYPFIQTGDVAAAQGVLKEYRKTYSEAGLAQSRLWPAGTVLITIAANIADSAILGLDACFPDSVVGLIPDVTGVRAEWVEYFLRVEQERLERFAPATAQKNINLRTLRAVVVPVPPLVEQDRILDELDTWSTTVSALSKSLARTKRRAAKARRSIVASAFSGRLVQQDPSDEQASELLKHIRAEKPVKKRQSKTKVSS
ncbi:MAG: restriction endonuclease subunit S [Actinobacteria bacterium]|nr:restriction endonuclease subunit S [Actinomycetota bacterium]